MQVYEIQVGDIPTGFESRVCVCVCVCAVFVGATIASAHVTVDHYCCRC